MNLTIIEIPQEEIGTNLQSAFPYMVQSEDGGVWFGSSNLEECEEYIKLHNT